MGARITDYLNAQDEIDYSITKYHPIVNPLMEKFWQI